MKTSELSGAQLDWAVAKCEKWDADWLEYHNVDDFAGYYSTDWAQGGLIIEREHLCVGYRHQPDPNYCEELDQTAICWARTTAGGYLKYGPTPLISAMRCYVASKLGEEIEIPEELK